MAGGDELLAQDEFAATAARVVAACAKRPLREQAKLLADGGLLGITIREEFGGLDLPLSFAVPVVAAAGSGLLEFPLLEHILVAQLLQQHLPRAVSAIVSGDESASIAWNGSVIADRSGNEVVLNGSVGRAPCAADVDWLLVRLDTNAVARIPMRATGITVEADAGIDLTVPERSVGIKDVRIPADHLFAEGAWRTLQADAALLRAAAIMGSAEASLAMAQEHASTRRQFGRALAYNQAIRHALARHKLALEGIRHAITRSVSFQAGGLEREAAFLAAGTYGASISEGAVQIFGGMGFTWDVSLHRHLRRIRTLQLQGDASGTIAALGRRYVAEVPAASNTSSPLER